MSRSASCEPGDQSPWARTGLCRTAAHPYPWICMLCSMALSSVSACVPPDLPVPMDIVCKLDQAGNAHRSYAA